MDSKKAHETCHYSEEAWAVGFLFALPAYIAALMLCIYFSCLVRRQGIYSGGFQSGRYIQFTMTLYRHCAHKCLVHFVIVAGSIGFLWALLLELIVSFDEASRLNAELHKVLFNGLVMFWSMKQLARARVHEQSWMLDGIQHFTFKRSIKDLLTQTNTDFQRKLLEALWEARHGHWDLLDACFDGDDPHAEAKRFLSMAIASESAEGGQVEMERASEAIPELAFNTAALLAVEATT